MKLRIHQKAPILVSCCVSVSMNASILLTITLYAAGALFEHLVTGRMSQAEIGDSVDAFDKVSMKLINV